MRSKLFFIGIAALLFAGCGQTVIKSGDLTLKIDGNMHYKAGREMPDLMKRCSEEKRQAFAEKAKQDIRQRRSPKRNARNASRRYCEKVQRSIGSPNVPTATLSSGK